MTRHEHLAHFNVLTFKFYRTEMEPLVDRGGIQRVQRSRRNFRFLSRSTGEQNKKLKKITHFNIKANQTRRKRESDSERGNETESGREEERERERKREVLID